MRHLQNKNSINLMFGLLRRLRTNSKEVEGGRCMRGSDRKLCFIETERGSVEGLYGKDHE